MLREFDYDDANRMRAVKHDGVVAMSYLYNGKGERVYKTGGGHAVTTVYDEAGKWIGDYDGNGNAIQQVIWLDDLPVGLLVGAGTNQKLYYIKADMLGTPRVVIDPTRNVAVWRWDLAGEAFGDSAPEQDVDGDGTALVFDMRFPGQRYDSATGLNYNYFRDYDPGAGRYVESDPIGLDGGASAYGYVGAAPFNLIDPLGLLPIPLPAPPPVFPIPGYQDSRQQLVDDLTRLWDRIDSDDDNRQKTYQTYTRYNRYTGQCYSGRTSGYGSPEENVKARGQQQTTLNLEGFRPPVLDRSSEFSDAIRGREQQLIELNGGARSSGGTSRNLINGISSFNPFRQYYLDSANAIFGPPVKDRTKSCQCR